MQTYLRGELVLVVDCLSLDAVADFWTAALGYGRAGRIFEPYLSLVPASGHGPELLLQRVPEQKSGKNRLHLDLRTADLATEVQRLTSIGATLLTEAPLVEGGWTWHVLADPEGNEFCVLQPPADHSWDGSRHSA